MVYVCSQKVYKNPAHGILSHTLPLPGVSKSGPEKQGNLSTLLAMVQFSLTKLVFVNASRAAR